MASYDAILSEVARRWPKDGAARRVFHGRGHSYPGLEHVTLTAWPPYAQLALFAEETDSWIDGLVTALVEEVGKLEGVDGLEGVMLQRRAGRATTSSVVFGEVPETHTTLEHGLKYKIQPLKNQNVGLFLDMGHVREDLAGTLVDARVLNLFAFTCAFSVYAIEHGARLVVNNDMSRGSLDVGKENHELNGHDLRDVRMLPHNVFKSWWKIRQLGPYDVIIVDPPTNQRGSFVAEKSYGQILKRIPEFAADGATVIASLNSPFLGPDFVTNQMARWAPDCRFVSQYPLHQDFPDAFPDRALKVLKFKYR